MRWPDPDTDRIRIAAEELIGLQPDLILTSGSLPVVELARETHTIPIVFVAVSDPIGSGLVASLAHPGGNITGFTNSEYSIGGKSLQTIKEIAPNVERAGVLFNPATALYAPHYLHSIEEVSSLAIPISALSVGNSAELEHAMRTLASSSQNAALIDVNDTFVRARREQIIALAAELRLPAIYPHRYFVTAGGLMSYGFESLELFRQAASYVDRILRGGETRRPADSAADQIRASHQHQDRSSARPHRSAIAARKRQRGDRVASPLPLLASARSALLRSAAQATANIYRAICMFLGVML